MKRPGSYGRNQSIPDKVTFFVEVLLQPIKGNLSWGDFQSLEQLIGVQEGNGYSTSGSSGQKNFLHICRHVGNEKRTIVFHYLKEGMIRVYTSINFNGSRSYRSYYSYLGYIPPKPTSPIIAGDNAVTEEEVAKVIRCGGLNRYQFSTQKLPGLWMEDLKRTYAYLCGIVRREVQQSGILPMAYFSPKVPTAQTKNERVSTKVSSPFTIQYWEQVVEVPFSPGSYDPLQDASLVENLPPIAKGPLLHYNWIKGERQIAEDPHKPVGLGVRQIVFDTTVGKIKSIASFYNKQVMPEKMLRGETKWLQHHLTRNKSVWCADDIVQFINNIAVLTATQVVSTFLTKPPYGTLDLEEKTDRLITFLWAYFADDKDVNRVAKAFIKHYFCVDERVFRNRPDLWKKLLSFCRRCGDHFFYARKRGGGTRVFLRTTCLVDRGSHI